MKAQALEITPEMLEALLQAKGGSAPKPPSAEERRQAAVEAMGRVALPCDHEAHGKLFASLGRVLEDAYAWDMLPDDVARRVRNVLVSRALHGEGDASLGMALDSERVMMAILVAGVTLGIGSATAPASEAPSERAVAGTGARHGGYI